MNEPPRVMNWALGIVYFVASGEGLREKSFLHFYLNEIHFTNLSAIPYD